MIILNVSLHFYSQDESDKLSFPNEEEFNLPHESFSHFLEEKMSDNNTEDQKSKSSKPKKDEEGWKQNRKCIPISSNFISIVSNKKEKSKDNEEEEERETPRRSLKRGRESLGKHSSSPAPSKRRR